MIITIISTTGIIITSVVVILILRKIMNKRIETLEDELRTTKSSLRSAYVKFGYAFEKFIPFSKNYPGNRERTIYVGNSVDYISFDDDKIRFIDCKTGNSRLNPRQLKIKKQIENGQVEFIELRY
jgi:predicted Holliday junction resolvase-like endonuclease